MSDTDFLRILGPRRRVRTALAAAGVAIAAIAGCAHRADADALARDITQAIAWRGTVTGLREMDAGACASLLQVAPGRVRRFDFELASNGAPPKATAACIQNSHHRPQEIDFFPVETLRQLELPAQVRNGV